MEDGKSAAKEVQTPILVTGGTGMVGTYLLRLLIRSGYENIRAIYRPDSDLSFAKTINGPIEWVECDLLDQVGLEDALEGIEQVYHCAGIISFRKIDRPYMMAVNVDGTANLVNMALQKKVKRLLHVSSSAALGRTKPGEVIDENKQWERSPYNTFYGLSKYLGEQEAWRGDAEGLEVVVVQPSIILGAHHWEEGPGRFFPMIDKGFRFFPAGGTGLVDVRDVVLFMKILMESDIKGERYLLNDDTLTYKDFFHRIARALGVKAPTTQINHLIQQVAWRATWLREKLTGKPSLVTRETAAQSSHTYYYPADKSRTELDFQYRDLNTTIQEMAACYLAWKKTGKISTLDF